MKYRSEVDGLRAIAVLSVIAYHYGALLPGGFVGVDVFFVISGYLITGKIVYALDAGRFTFREFYTRRARRILPALFATLIGCFVASVVLLSPEQLHSFAASLLASVLCISNLYFQATAGYFDQASTLKPLLHIWSLSVEEQFYLVYPLMLLTAFKLSRRLGCVTLIIGAGILSFALNLSFQEGHSPLIAWWPRVAGWFKNGYIAIFYFTPFRVFEFAIGGVLVWLPKFKRSESIANELLLILGVALIFYAGCAYSDKLLYPSWNALVPCFGAALVIYAGAARYAAALLRNAVAVRIGLVSYSLYLVHWPIIVFAQLYLYRSLTPFEFIFAAIGSYAMAELMYRFVEQPFRVGAASRHIGAYGAAGATVMLLVVGLSYMAKAQNGWTWRLSEHLVKVATENARSSPQIRGPLGCEGSCEFGNPKGPNILVVGDSHIDQYTKTLDRMAGDRYHFYLAYAASCYFGARLTARLNPYLGPLCQQAKETLRQWLSSRTFQGIILGERWPGYEGVLQFEGGQILKTDDVKLLYSVMLRDVEDLYAGFQGPVVVVGHAPDTNTSCYLKPRLATLVCPPVPLQLNQAFKPAFTAFKESTSLNVDLIDPVDTICPNGVCRISDDRGHALYSDSVHLSVYGAALIVPQILRALEKTEGKHGRIASNEGDGHSQREKR